MTSTNFATLRSSPEELYTDMQFDLYSWMSLSVKRLELRVIQNPGQDIIRQMVRHVVTKRDNSAGHSISVLINHDFPINQPTKPSSISPAIKLVSRFNINH
jgi:hypothetical protein